MDKTLNFDPLIAINDFYNHISALRCTMYSKFWCHLYFLLVYVLVCNRHYFGMEIEIFARCYLLCNGIENEKSASSQLQILHIQLHNASTNQMSHQKTTKFLPTKQCLLKSESISPSNHTSILFISQEIDLYIRRFLSSFVIFSFVFLLFAFFFASDGSL